MKKFVFAYLLAGCVSAQSLAQTPQSYAKTDPLMQQRLNAANEYYKVVPMEDAVMQMAVSLIGSSQFKNNPELLNKIMSSFDVNKIKDAAIQRLAYHFTFDEIMAMRDFYSSPEGQSIYQKTPSYLADLAPVVRNEAMKAAQKVMQDAIMPQQVGQ